MTPPFVVDLDACSVRTNYIFLFLSLRYHLWALKSPVMRLKLRSSVLIGIIFLLSILPSFLKLYLRYFKNGKEYDSQEAKKSFYIREEQLQRPHVIVLLQQSPVLQSQQLTRLHSIDMSWAQWLPCFINFRSKGNVCFRSTIVAAIPFDCSNCSASEDSEISFRKVKLYRIMPPSSNISKYLTTHTGTRSIIMKIEAIEAE
mmetsp:Transcript_11732/g.16125  ORF Transcript_11732/g.16125 Transcript_11732/m.16125 type:complete len:201 (-) Transcript_11732:1935-2537(-)